MNEYDNIYSKMTETNYNYLNSNLFSFDSSLTTSCKNSLDNLDSPGQQQKCVALVCAGSFDFSDKWHEFKNKITSYAPLSKLVFPELHHTFLVIKQWKQCDNSSNISAVTPSECESLLQLLVDVPKYSVIFDRFIPVKTGLVLCGTPTININLIRDHIRKSVCIDPESYHLNICHMTMLRWTSQLTDDEQRTFLEWIKSLGVQRYVTLRVNTIDIVHATWLMDQKDISVLDSIKLN